MGSFWVTHNFPSAEIKDYEANFLPGSLDEVAHVWSLFSNQTASLDKHPNSPRSVSCYKPCFNNFFTDIGSLKRLRYSHCPTVSQWHSGMCFLWDRTCFSSFWKNLTVLFCDTITAFDELLVSIHSVFNLTAGLFQPSGFIKPKPAIQAAELCPGFSALALGCACSDSWFNYWSSFEKYCYFSS